MSEGFSARSVVAVPARLGASPPRAERNIVRSVPCVNLPISCATQVAGSLTNQDKQRDTPTGQIALTRVCRSRRLYMPSVKGSDPNRQKWLKVRAGGWPPIKGIFGYTAYVSPQTVSPLRAGITEREMRLKGMEMKDIIQTFKSHYKPLKLDNVREIDLKSLTIQYTKWLKAGGAVGKCS